MIYLAHENTFFFSLSWKTCIYILHVKFITTSTQVFFFCSCDNKSRKQTFQYIYHSIQYKTLAMKLQPLMSLHTRGFVAMSWAKLWSVHVSDAAQWAVNDGSRSRRWPLSHLEAAVRYYTYVTGSSSLFPPPPPVQCEHVGLMSFFFPLRLGPEEAAAWSSPQSSRVESSSLWRKM